MKAKLLKRFRKRYDYYFYKNELKFDMVRLLDKDKKSVHTSIIESSYIYALEVMNIFDFFYFRIKKQNKKAKRYKQMRVSNFYKEKQKNKL